MPGTESTITVPLSIPSHALQPSLVITNPDEPRRRNHLAPAPDAACLPCSSVRAGRSHRRLQRWWRQRQHRVRERDLPAEPLTQFIGIDASIRATRPRHDHAEQEHGGASDGQGAIIFQSQSVSYARAATLQGDRLAIADTYGQRVLVQSITSGELLNEIASSFPNDVEWRGDFLYGVEEHVDRIIAINTASDERFVVMAPPLANRWSSTLPADQEFLDYCGPDGEHRRSVASDPCSEESTVYASNGLELTPSGTWVADTDNFRVNYIENGVLTSGLNGPVKVASFN